jgi:hypothetical protein
LTNFDAIAKWPAAAAPGLPRARPRRPEGPGHLVVCLLAIAYRDSALALRFWLSIQSAIGDGSGDLVIGSSNQSSSGVQPPLTA